MTSDITLRTIDICRFYRRGPQTVKAVDGVDIEVKKGEFAAIVGSSGSGKSTLLALLAGLDTPTSGVLEVDGISLQSLSRKELAAYRANRVGVVFQSFNLIPHYTALRNVEMGLYFNQTPYRERRRIAGDMLDRLGLGDRIDHRPADLSGGEQQRVALARALAKQPDILFADEPTGNLDEENSAQVASLFDELSGRGLTIVLVTHDMALARKHAHRLVRLSYGRVVTETGEVQS